LVLGTGGASKAVQYVLRQLGIEYLIVSRNVSTSAGFIMYEDINEAVMNEYSIVINCTPVGMWPNENSCPDIPYELISSWHYLYDLVYKPDETLFLKKGKNNGAVTQNGYEMLVIQAEESWRIWNHI
jgi:shikimate dehydrogenase